MEYRVLGQTGLTVSALGFGCGSVGGLLVRGERKEIAETVARAVELGVTYFDTAPPYGNGRSEINLAMLMAGRSWRPSRMPCGIPEGKPLGAA
jgi:L-galactose dehydrogenase/L-glyceraldehyde 3-phosphate reductase